MKSQLHVPGDGAEGFLGENLRIEVVCRGDIFGVQDKLPGSQGKKRSCRGNFLIVLVGRAA